MKKLVDLLFVISVSCFLLLTAYSILPTAFLYAQAGWKPDQRLTYFWGYSYDPRAACCGDTVYLVWWEHYGVSGQTREEVFYKRSTDAGETWGEDVRLSEEDEQTSALPQITASENTVHIIWFEEDFGFLYRRSVDGGTTWQDIDSIMPGMTYPSICAVGDTVYVAGTIGSFGVLRFTKSHDGGNIWQPIMEITQANSSPCIRTISNDGLSLVVSYDKYDSPVCVEVYQVLSHNGGETWLDSFMISDYDSIGSQWSVMDTDDSGGIHVTWYDYKYSPYAWTGDIFYRASRDSGNSWEEIDSLTTQHRAVASDILAEGTNLHLVWEDDRHDFGDNFEIYYRMSTDLGQTWTNEVRLTDAVNWSRRPSLACDGNYLHLFWFDLRDDPNNIVGEIYYKRKTLTGIQEATTNDYQSGDLSLYCSTILKSNSLIQYDLGSNKEGEITLIDVTGKVIVTLPVYCYSGEFALSFNKEVCPGVYFLMLKAGRDYIVEKIMVMY
jgi:Neuraminidase (sialidase)